jgi:hypothetical protein
MKKITFIQLLADYIEMLPLENMTSYHIANNIVEKCEDLGMSYRAENCDCPAGLEWREEDA